MLVERKLYVLFVWMPGTSMLAQNAGYRIERWPPIMVMTHATCMYVKPKKGIFSNLHDRKRTNKNAQGCIIWGWIV
jgi:hypothetical protein